MPSVDHLNPDIGIFGFGAACIISFDESSELPKYHNSPRLVWLDQC